MRFQELLFVTGLFLLPLLIWCYFAEHRSRNEEDVRESETYEEPSLHATLAGMTREEKRDYYSELFQRNGNELVLSKDQIVTVEDLDGNHEEGDDPSLYLSLENPSGFASNAASTRTRRSSFLVFETSDNCGTDRPSLDGTSTTTTTTDVRGTCIICFEDFEAGDTIVRSTDTRSCKHVYHKSCMVDYLSLQKTPKPGMRGSKDEYHPSCPTCRQQFCKLLPPAAKTREQRDNDTGTIDADAVDLEGGVASAATISTRVSRTTRGMVAAFSRRTRETPHDLQEEAQRHESGALTPVVPMIAGAREQDLVMSINAVSSPPPATSRRSSSAIFYDIEVV